MSSRAKGFPGTAMPAEEAEETFSQFCPLHQAELQGDALNRRIFPRLNASVYGSTVGGAKRRPRLSIRPIFSETEGAVKKPSESSAQLMGKRRTCSGSLSLRLSGFKQRVLSCGLRILALPKVAS